MKKPIKTGLLSFGMSGKIFHAPFLTKHIGFELVAVVERSEKRAHLLLPDIKSYSSVDEICADADIELIVVNTPNDTHFGFAMKALQSGKNVLMEKPFAVTSVEAKKLYSEAKHRNLHILPYQNRRFDSDFLSLKSVLDSGKLGRLIEAHIRFDRYRHSIGPKVFKETAIPGSGLMYDLGPHMLDQDFALFGMPEKWSKTVGHFRPNTQVDDYGHIHLQYSNGLNVFVTLSMLVADVQPAYVLNGTKGSYVKHRADVQERQLLEGITPADIIYGVEDGVHEGILTTILDGGEKSQQLLPAIKTSYISVFDAVYHTMRDDKPYFVTEEQVLKQLEILEGR